MATSSVKERFVPPSIVISLSSYKTQSLPSLRCPAREHASDETPSCVVCVCVERKGKERERETEETEETEEKIEMNRKQREYTSRWTIETQTQEKTNKQTKKNN